MYKTVALACDHAGFSLKNELMLHLSSRGIEFRDFGTYNEESCDYPDYAAAACRAVLSGECDCAILVCGTGVGMSIAANKFDGIRAACASDSFSVKFTRLHNDANVLCLGGRVVGPGLGCELADIFVSTEYEGGRHQRRLDMISKIEKGEKL